MAYRMDIWYASCIAFSAGAGAWFMRLYALGRGLLDHPGERRSHRTPTPRGGGVGIVGAWLFALAVSWGARPDLAPALVAILAGSSLVAGIGWIDDHRPLSPWLRLAVHAIAAALLSWAVWQQGGGMASALLAFVAALVLVNVWNFMDGIDGLSASQAAIAAASYALLAVDSTIVALSWLLAIACCGFLPFNFPKARIFLGDVGSGALGYALAALVTLVAMEQGGGVASWPILLIPLSAFLIDASLTLCRRMLRGDRWWTPHVEHAYQRWAFRAGAHWPVTLAYAAWTVFGTVIMLIAIRTTATQGQTAINIALAVGWGLTGALAWWRIMATPPQNQLGRSR